MIADATSFAPRGVVACVLLMGGTALSDDRPAAHWSFDGPTAVERLAESYGRAELDASQQSGVSSWQPRDGFGETLANGSSTVHLVVPSHVSPGSGDFSVVLWSYRTTGNSSLSGLVDALSSSAGSGWQWFYQADNTLRLRLDDTAGNDVLVDTPGAHVTLNTWKHLAFTVDRSAGRARVFVDGVEATAEGGVAVTSLIGAITPDQNLWIGTLNGTNAANGRIDDFAVFHRALGGDEIAALAAGATVLSLYPDAPSSPAVVFDPPSGATLVAGESVTLSSHPPGVEIRYTQDGSAPDGSSPLYAGPIVLSESVTLRAVAGGGEVSSAEYTVVPDQVPEGASLLLISVEQVGFGDLGCYGSPIARTPHLDVLAAGGLRFTQAYNTGPGGTGNLYAMLTGRYYDRSGCGPEIGPAEPGVAFREWTLAEQMRKSGRECGFFGVWRLGSGPGSSPLDQGYQHFTGLPWEAGISPVPPLVEDGVVLNPSPDPVSLLDAFRDAASAFIGNADGQPFFAHVHLPVLPADHDSQSGPAGRRIEAVDAAVGHLISELERLNRREDTMVLFVSTGGANRADPLARGSSGLLRDGAGTTWEGGVRAVSIASWPGVIPAAQSLAPWSLADMPLCLAAFLKTGWIDDGRHIDGLDRPGVFRGLRRTALGDEVFAFHLDQGNGVPTISAMRKGVWKYHAQTRMTDPDNPSSNTSVPRLYDVEKDPAEFFTRHSAFPDILADLENEAAGHLAGFTPENAALPSTPVIDGGVMEVESFGIDGEGPPRFVFTRPADLLDDAYVLEISDNLRDWAEYPLSLLERSVSPAASGERVEFIAPAAGEGTLRRFFRLKSKAP